MLLEELKAKAYDLISLIEQGRAKLQELNIQIAKETEKAKESPKVDEVKK